MFSTIRVFPSQGLQRIYVEWFELRDIDAEVEFRVCDEDAVCCKTKKLELEATYYEEYYE